MIECACACVCACVCVCVCVCELGVPVRSPGCVDQVSGERYNARLGVSAGGRDGDRHALVHQGALLLIIATHLALEVVHTHRWDGKEEGGETVHSAVQYHA